MMCQAWPCCGEVMARLWWAHKWYRPCGPLAGGFQRRGVGDECNTQVRTSPPSSPPLRHLCFWLELPGDAVSGVPWSRLESSVIRVWQKEAKAETAKQPLMVPGQVWVDWSTCVWVCVILLTPLCCRICVFIPQAALTTSHPQALVQLMTHLLNS